MNHVGQIPTPVNAPPGTKLERVEYPMDNYGMLVGTVWEVSSWMERGGVRVVGNEGIWTPRFFKIVEPAVKEKRKSGFGNFIRKVEGERL